MASFDPNQYETVAERLQRAHADHKDLRIHNRIVEVVRDDQQRPLQYIIESNIYYGDVLMFVDIAEEVVGSSFINKANALENASTSATGRSLSLAGYMGVDPVTKKPVRALDQDMRKSERVLGSPMLPPANKAPKPKKEFAKADIDLASTLITSVATSADKEELKLIWQDNADILDCEAEGTTLRNAITKRVAELA